MTETATIENVQQTLAEYERLALSTGSKMGFGAPEFMNAQGVWSPVWIAETHPEAARATVTRDGVETTVTAAWRECVPAVDEWRELWERRPMKLFGAYVRRDAIRRACRDVIGDRREPDETVEPPTPTAAKAEPRDWMADLAAAATDDDVRNLHRDAKSARAITVELERAIRARLLELRASASPVPSPPVPSKPTSRPKAASPAKTPPAPKPPSPADLAAALKKAGITAEPKPARGARRPQKPKARRG